MEIVSVGGSVDIELSFKKDRYVAYANFIGQIYQVVCEASCPQKAKIGALELILNKR